MEQRCIAIWLCDLKLLYWRFVSSAAALLGCLHETPGERMWLYQWLRKDGASPLIGCGEDVDGLGCSRTASSMPSNSVPHNRPGDVCARLYGGTSRLRSKRWRLARRSTSPMAVWCGVSRRSVVFPSVHSSLVLCLASQASGGRKPEWASVE